MTAEAGWLEPRQEGDGLSVAVGGRWTVAVADTLDAAVHALAAPAARRVRFDLSAVEAMDTAGAWILHRAARQLSESGIDSSFTGVGPLHEPLLRIAEQSDKRQDLDRPSASPFLGLLNRLGAAVYFVAHEARDLIAFFGLTIITLGRTLLRPGRLRFVALTNQIEQTGLNAIPIVCLLSFLIGVVLAYQGADQLRRFGAEVFTVNLLAVSVLREIGVLMTSIMVAGRSGSAFTAQIGTMQVNEEVSAMRTLGLDPIEVLVVPRVVGLMIALPLLTFIADIMGVLGGAIMAVLTLDLSTAQFIKQFKDAATVDQFLVGMVKAPVFAFIIAMVGCFEGLRVEGSADSVGRMTTRSVVEAIFLVIVADAVFSILFSTLGI